MLQRVACVLLVVALGSAGASAPFAHLHPQDHHPAAPQPEAARAHSHAAHHQWQGAHWHLTGHQTTERPGTTALVGNRHHHARMIAVATVAVEGSSVRAGAVSAPAELWEAEIVPECQGRRMPVAANARPNPPPPVLLAARAPPVSPSGPSAA